MMRFWVVVILVWLVCGEVWAQPARRIISLAPHITELLFAIGAGAWIVGTVQYSDYPPAAQKIPRVGSYEQFDLESILVLAPDLIIAWPSGNPANQIAKLQQLKLPIVSSDPKHVLDIPADMYRLGEQVGTSAITAVQVEAFTQSYRQLQQRFASKPKVRVFYQIWDRPLMTINGQHVISDVIQLCGGENIFHSLPILAPTVSVEAVLQANPEVIIASGMAAERPEWLDAWRRWPHLTAVAQDQLVAIHPDLLQRHTPRILQGATQLCDHLERVRQKKPDVAPP